MEKNYFNWFESLTTNANSKISLTKIKICIQKNRRKRHAERKIYKSSQK